VCYTRLVQGQLAFDAGELVFHRQRLQALLNINGVPRDMREQGGNMVTSAALTAVEPLANAAGAGFHMAPLAFPRDGTSTITQVTPANAITAAVFARARSLNHP